MGRAAPNPVAGIRLPDKNDLSGGLLLKSQLAMTLVWALRPGVNSDVNSDRATMIAGGSNPHFGGPNLKDELRSLEKKLGLASGGASGVL